MEVQIVKKICRTKFLKGAIDNDEALSMFAIIRDMIEWEAGVPSKKHGFTRKGKPMAVDEHPFILNLVTTVLDKITDQKYGISHIYLNYYENGNMFTPNHSHKGTHQLVISLGGSRTLEVSKKNYKMENGDAIIFGSAIHGVPKEQTYEPRISIATFMIPISVQ